MTQIECEIYGIEETVRALGKFPMQLLEVIDHELHAGANKIARTAKQLCPVGKREFEFEGMKRTKIFSLKNSIEVEKGDELEYFIGTNHYAAEWIEYGTAPHPIYPRFAKVLRFKGKRDGKIIFAPYVKHPGTQPQPFLEPALFEHVDTIQENITKVIKSTIETIGAGGTE